jgi:hypothetical protein
MKDSQKQPETGTRPSTRNKLASNHNETVVRRSRNRLASNHNETVVSTKS